MSLYIFTTEHGYSAFFVANTINFIDSSQPSHPVLVTAPSDSLNMTDDLTDLYQPSESQSTLSTSQLPIAALSVVSDWKFLVFESHLDKLLCHLVRPT